MRSDRSFLLRYGGAVVVVLLASLLRWELSPWLGSRSPVSLFVLAVLVSAQYGYQVATELRRHADLARARLIALSGYGQAEDQRRSREAGFDLHLIKPVEFEELRQLLLAKP